MCALVTGVQTCALPISYREKAEGLGAEESTQYSLGVVWDATDWMNITADYWNIEIEDRIAYFGSQKLINIDNGVEPTPMPAAPCSLTRDPPPANARSEERRAGQGVVSQFQSRRP